MVFEKIEREFTAIEKVLPYGWQYIKLENRDGKHGIKYRGEVLMDFMMDAGLRGTDSLAEINRALTKCGLKEIDADADLFCGIANGVNKYGELTYSRKLASGRTVEITREIMGFNVGDFVYSATVRGETKVAKTQSPTFNFVKMMNWALDADLEM